MLKISCVTRWIALTAAAGCAFTAITLHQVRAENRGQLIATVDLLKVYGPDWKTFKAENDHIKEMQDKFRSIVQEFVPDNGTDAAVPPVETTVVTAWLGLKEKAVLHPDSVKDDDRKNLADYQNQGKQATERLISLENKGANLSDAEKTELAHLQQLRTQAQQTINAQAQQYSDQLQTEFKDTQQKMEVQVQDAINKVGAEQGITYVVNASVISQLGGTQKIVLFSSDKNIDVTDQVIKRLNK